MKMIDKITTILVALTLPYVLIMFSIRVLFTPLFLVFEYNLPGFPVDSYGFTTEERLKWGTLSMQYLFDDGEVESLEDLRFQNGEQIYNQREISHMVDVKILLQQTLMIFYILLAIYLLIILWHVFRKQVHLLWNALSKGGWITLGLIGAILVAVVVSFDALFTAFHKVFFAGDTWLFRYSDTLIRLFPIQLWQDAFIFMGIITIGLALFFAIYGNKKKYKKIVEIEN